MYALQLHLFLQLNSRNPPIRTPYIPNCNAKFVYDKEPRHGQRLVMRPIQSSLPCTTVKKPQELGPCWSAGSFYSIYSDKPSYHRGSLVRHPRAAPSRGYRFLRGINNTVFNSVYIDIVSLVSIISPATLLHYGI
jgi:hypothetical protein